MSYPKHSRFDVRSERQKEALKPKHSRFGVRSERQIEALKLHETGRQSVIKLEIEIRYYHSDMPDRFDYVVKVRRFDDVVGKDEL